VIASIEDRRVVWDVTAAAIAPATASRCAPRGENLIVIGISGGEYGSAISTPTMPGPAHAVALLHVRARGSWS